MNVQFRKLHPTIGAEVTIQGESGQPLDLRQVHDGETLQALRRGMDEHAVLVFRRQPFTNEEQVAFAQRFDGALHTKLGSNAVAKNRFGNDAIADISNVNEEGKIRDAADRQRVYSLANRLWHTDASFQDPPGRYSMLSARVIPPPTVRADTEFADMRAAYDALDEATKKQIEGLKAHHSIAYSRMTLGFEFNASELDMLRGAIHPMTRTNPRTGRKSIYVASHANRIIDWPLAEARLLIADLMMHSTQRHFVYTHIWEDQDLVIWDNLATMHRGRPYDDANHHRELRRVTTLDLDFEPGQKAMVLPDSVQV